MCPQRISPTIEGDDLFHYLDRIRIDQTDAAIGTGKLIINVLRKAKQGISGGSELRVWVDNFEIDVQETVTRHSVRRSGQLNLKWEVNGRRGTEEEITIQRDGTVLIEFIEKRSLMPFGGRGELFIDGKLTKVYDW